MFRAAGLYSEPPHLFARALNWLIYEGEGQKTIDLAAVWVDPAGGKVQFCLAGDGVRLGRARADGTCSFTDAKGLPAIGQTRAPAYEAISFGLAPGDSIILATAGFETTLNAKQEVLGQTGLQDSLSDGMGSAPSQVLSEFVADLNEFTTGGSCPDDLTVVLAQWK
jgi:serine phosphatase RsbU (regulator of sigma subunit)